MRMNPMPTKNSMVTLTFVPLLFLRHIIFNVAWRTGRKPLSARPMRSVSLRNHIIKHLHHHHYCVSRQWNSLLNLSTLQVPAPQHSSLQPLKPRQPIRRRRWWHHPIKEVSQIRYDSHYIIYTNKLYCKSCLNANCHTLFCVSHL